MPPSNLSSSPAKARRQKSSKSTAKPVASQSVTATSVDFYFDAATLLDGILPMAVGRGPISVAMVQEATNGAERLLRTKLTSDLEFRLAESLRSISSNVLPLIELQSHIRSPELAKAYKELFGNLSLLDARFSKIEEEDLQTLDPARSELLEREKVAFDNAAKTAAQLAEEIESLQPAQRAQLRPALDKLLAKAFATSAASDRSPERAKFPEYAPELWSARSEHAGETALGFLQRVYSTWLPEMRLVDLTELDQPLYQALQTWRRRNKPPIHLNHFFVRERRTAAEIDAELRKYRIRKPEDAFARFPNDRVTAQRLYQACKSRLGLRSS